MRIKIFLVVGARPNFMKIAPIYSEMKKEPQIFDPIIVHTGQHYDEKMSKVFFEELELPKPRALLTCPVVANYHLLVLCSDLYPHIF